MGVAPGELLVPRDRLQRSKGDSDTAKRRIVSIGFGPPAAKDGLKYRMTRMNANYPNRSARIGPSSTATKKVLVLREESARRREQFA